MDIRTDDTSFTIFAQRVALRKRKSFRRRETTRIGLTKMSMDVNFDGAKEVNHPQITQRGIAATKLATKELKERKEISTTSSRDRVRSPPVEDFTDATD